MFVKALVKSAYTKEKAIYLCENTEKIVLDNMEGMDLSRRMGFLMIIFSCINSGVTIDGLGTVGNMLSQCQSVLIGLAGIRLLLIQESMKKPLDEYHRMF